MLDTDHSTGQEIAYTFGFTGCEDYLKDHVVNHNVLFPAAAYVEMVAGALKDKGYDEDIEITNCYWISPLLKGNVVLKIDKAETLKFEFSAEQGLHCKGKIALHEKQQEPLSIPISEIKNTLKLSKSGRDFYDLLRHKNLNYGESFQGIKEVYYERGVALAKINLTPQSGLILTPALLDSALQASVATLFEGGLTETLVPSHVESIKIYGKLPEKIWSFVTRKDNEKSGYQFDIKITDEYGKLLVDITNLRAYPLTIPEKTTHTMENQNNIRTRLYNYKWDVSSPESKEYKKQNFEHIFLCGSWSDSFIKNLWTNQSVETTLIPEESIENCFMLILNGIKRIKKGRVLIIYHNSQYLEYNYLAGLVKTVNLENPYISGVVMGIDENDADSLLNNIEREKYHTDTEVMIRNDKRWIKKLIPIDSRHPAPSVARAGGVYLITGGAGGIGKIFSEYLAQTEGVQVIITGRTPEYKIGTSKANIHYLSCDISSRTETAALISRIKHQFGKITGIIHGAGIIQDSYLVNKTEEEIKNVFAPKIKGAINLDEETGDEKLDFFVFLSSLASIAGNIGQADYASANAWMDNFAAYRNERVKTGKRSGASRSINWPLWKNGGMRIDDMTAGILEKKWGMLPMPSEEGIYALEALLFHNIDQGAAIYGNKEFSLKEDDLELLTTKHEKVEITHDMALIKKKTADHILSVVCDILNYEKEELDPESELRNYGFSSYLLVKFSNDLNEYYDLNEPPSIFYNYPTVNAMADFLCATHREKILAKHGAEKASDCPVPIHTSEKIEDYSGFSDENTVNDDSEDDDLVVIVGIAGRFPGADNVQELWELVKNNQDAVSEIPEERWDWKKYYGKRGEALDKTKAKWGGFIKDIDKFDADYFNINPKEAEIMDPQQRITLETVYTALNDAGIAPSSLKGSDAGVYIGVMNNDYSKMLYKHPELSRHAYTVVNSDTILANRISYLLDLHGPSEPVKTACSSALIAVHRASEAIRTNQCEMAIAGGVNAIFIPETTLMISNGGMLSETGRCWSFDERADGYVRSEGVGIVILKSLRLAKEDGDRIYGIIRGSEENHGGRANSLTAPNPKAQKDLLVQAFRKADVDPARISYIEAHGTGTALGDPIEIEGLKTAFKTFSQEKNQDLPQKAFCGIGSIKANIGHTESASGVAGIFKVLMAMRHKTLPGNPLLVNPNPYLKISESPFYLLKNTIPWEHDPNLSRIAGISSFGFGGSNAHMIIEEYKTSQTQYENTHPAIIVLSAKNKERLKEYAGKLHEHIKQNPSVDIHSIAYTLLVGREHLEERIGWIAENTGHLRAQINTYLDEGTCEFSGNTVQEKASLKILNETFDEDAKQQLLKKSDYRQLIRLWCIGIKFDWSLIYERKRPEKAELPAYPFERRRYWLSEYGKEALPEALSSENKTDKIENKLLNIISHTINRPVGELDTKADFFEFGLDSVSGFELIRQINESFKVKIDFSILYEYTTIATLTEFITQKTRVENSEFADTY